MQAYECLYPKASKEKHLVTTITSWFTKVNGGPCFGAAAPYRKTESHAHVMGVINALITCSGSKLWTFTSPKGDESFQERQGPGDVIWCPPGWAHGVFTEGGESMGDGILACMHLVGWVMNPVLLQHTVQVHEAHPWREGQSKHVSLAQITHNLTALHMKWQHCFTCKDETQANLYIDPTDDNPYCSACWEHFYKEPPLPALL